MQSTDYAPKESSLYRLPGSTVKLLSSGQVIISVSTAVKELVENAIDAGATNIEVKLEKEGFEKIEVIDNGHGIRLEDIAFMCQKGYTSKIRNFSDLDNINSYGFRGEALSSLCAISRVSITSKTYSDEVATSFNFNNKGEIISSKVSHLNKGCIITLQDLFKNLPVRKQYLTGGKRKARELKSVGCVVKSFGLIHPKLRIVLSHNKVCIWQKNSVQSLGESLVQIVPITVAKHLHEINYSDDKFSLQMILPKKDCHVWSTCYGIPIQQINLFINTRPVRNNQIEKAIQEEIYQFFGSAIPENKTPFCVIAITLSTCLVDVNLEPNKTKVIVKDLDCLIKALRSQVVFYYFGALEPPRPGTNENINENVLKRKSADRASMKSKPTKKNEKNENNEKKIKLKKKKINSSIALDDTIINDHQKNPINEALSTFKESMESTGAINFLQFSQNDNHQAKIVDTSSTNLGDTFILEESFFEDSIHMKKSEKSKHITVSHQDLGENSTKNDNLIDIISHDNASNDSFCEEFLKKLSEDLKRSIDDDNLDIKTSTQKKIVEFETLPNETGKKKEVNLNEITLSQWGKGHVMLNGEIIECSTMIGKKIKVEQLNRNTSTTCQQDTLGKLEKSISSQMGCKEMSAFTSFARDIRSKIIQRTPEITFTAMASELASKWKNLHEDDKKIYKVLAKEKKRGIHRNNKSFRINGHPDLSKPKPRWNRYNPSVPENIERKYPFTKSIDISIDKLMVALEKRINYKFLEVNLITKLDESLIIIYDNGRVNALSLGRLKEAVRFHINLEKMNMPFRLLDVRISILKSDIGPELWNVLETFETSFDEIFVNIIVISDERVTKNGFRIEKVPDTKLGLPGNKYYLTDVPSCVEFDLNDLKQILQFISTNGNIQLRDCRPVKLMNFIKEETMRDVTCDENINTLDETDALELYKLWSYSFTRISNNCPHFRPVSKNLYPKN